MMRKEKVPRKRSKDANKVNTASTRPAVPPALSHDSRAALTFEKRTILCSEKLAASQTDKYKNRETK